MAMMMCRGSATRILRRWSSGAMYLQVAAGSGWRSKEVGRSTPFAEGGMQALSAAFVASPLSSVSESQDVGHFQEMITAEERVSRRSLEGPVSLEAPIKLIYEMLQKKGFINEKTEPLPIDQVAGCDDHRIVAWYRNIAIGLLKYYSFCDNLAKVRAIANYILRWSAIYTLAKKHKSSSSKIIEKHTKSLIITEDGVTLAAYLTPDEIGQYKKFILDSDPTPPEVLIDVLFARLIRKKLLVERCAVKGCEKRNVEMHHMRQIEKAGGKHKIRSAREAQILESIKAMQNSLNKKHIPLCVQHHDDLQMGKVFISDLDMNVIL